jgi:hypothetical protein
MTVRMTMPSREWKERIAEGEKTHLEQLAEQLRDAQRALAAGRSASRALHAKGQAPARAQLTVLAEVPDHAKVGLFGTPKTYEAFVRFSNGSAARQSDGKGDVRGVAIKVLGVAGPKIIPGLEAATTQDFLLIQSPTTPFRSPEEFVWFVLASRSPALLLPRAIGRLGFGTAIRMLRKLASGLSRPVVSLATSRYYSALPIAFGPYAAKYALVPRASAPEGAKPARSPEYLTEELMARLSSGPVEYDFSVQFFADEQTTPIEDSTVEWTTPFVTLARLTIPAQDLTSAEGRALGARIEQMSFDPWHATADFRPLGAMMRARNAAYRLSTQERGAAPEPTN